ncbi:MAG: hypothetical protein K6T75_07865, partial [Acetobacteraceae bacterium]|nr:hypothetical protein [Acetobacteraceae bacterium]
GYTVRPLGPQEYELVYEWFAQDDFYLDTPDPARETEARVRELIEFPTSHLLLVVDAEDRPCALVDVIFRQYFRIADLEVGFAPGFSDLKERQKVFDAVTRLLLSETFVLRAQKLVYEFDEAGRACCEASGYEQEVRLRRQVFRRGRWWDVLIYGRLREPAEAAEAGRDALAAGAGDAR